MPSELNLEDIRVTLLEAMRPNPEGISFWQRAYREDVGYLMARLKAVEGQLREAEHRIPRPSPEPAPVPPAEPGRWTPLVQLRNGIPPEAGAHRWRDEDGA